MVKDDIAEKKKKKWCLRHTKRACLFCLNGHRKLRRSGLQIEFLFVFDLLVRVIQLKRREDDEDCHSIYRPAAKHAGERCC